MSETKDQIAAERDQLRTDNAALRAQLAAAGQPSGAYRPAAQFVLSEGARQELERTGVANVGGRQMTREQVLAKLGDDQAGVQIAEPSAALDQRGTPHAARAQSAVPGVDFVWPSVAPGQIDPAVAGTPGINGPAATAAPEPADDPADDE